ncbi:MAG TPA: amylo-alpha-1,6-glucosidase [Candidatus Baltobacteraceae bacterium]|nr:amylo-alpha-1,6-glucosidase [Candidatus Baltobacteraceae bacterium]
MTSEWLCTNGLGGYASGTKSDVLERRYHGLLVAALDPPLGRRVLLSKFDASAVYNGVSYDLSSNRWHDGTLAPQGFRLLVDFRLDGRVPAWTYAFADALLERRIWMEHGANTTYVQWTLRDASAPVELVLKAYVNDRDYHALTHAFDVCDVARVEDDAATIRLGDGTAWHLKAPGARLESAADWYYGFRYDAERERGLDDVEDLYHALTIHAQLPRTGANLLVTASLDANPGVPADPHARERELLARWKNANPRLKNPPAWIEALVLAADQFVVARTIDGAPGCTVIAGYHWFGDWGRDTMIALPGLALTTGAPEVAGSILRTFARTLDRGMLPNRFPDSGQAPEYNTVDAALWFIEAVRLYHAATHDRALLEELFDALHAIVDWYARGTRYDIAVDERDGLLRAGTPGVQLTWMDAKIGDWVVTPRIGKPIEINALWYNALCTLDAFAQKLGRDPTRYRDLGSRARASFGRFWNEQTNYPFDVLDGPDGNDAAIRPNAVYAVALPFRAFESRREHAIVDRIARELWTPMGLRSLAPSDPAYVGRYAGSPSDRDAAYHRGTAWPFLAGAFARAYANAYGDRRRALRFIEAVAAHINTYGIGTLAEIADGDPPHDPRGCIAQAWSVGEALRTWHALEEIEE